MAGYERTPGDASATSLQLATGTAVKTRWPAAERDAVFITKFATGHGWTSSVGGGSVDLNDTTDAGPFGFQSVKLVNGGGAAPTVTSGAISVDTTAAQSLILWIKVTDAALLTGASGLLTVYAGDSGLANYYAWTVLLPTIHSEWVAIELRTNTAVITGTPPATLVKARVQNDGLNSTVLVGGLAYRPDSTLYPNGLVTFTFDDANLSIFTEARPKLDQYGYGATAFVICDVVDVGGPSTAQLQQMRDVSGWEVALHAFTTAAHTALFDTLTLAQVEAEFQGGKDWLESRGFTSDAWAPPGNHTNEAIWGVARKYVNMSRAAGATTAGGISAAPLVNPTLVVSMTYDSTTAATAAAMVTAIAAAKSTKSWLILNLHKIDPTTSSGEQISRADFASIVDACNTQGVAVRTFEQVRQETALASSQASNVVQVGSQPLSGGFGPSASYLTPTYSGATTTNADSVQNRGRPMKQVVGRACVADRIGIEVTGAGEANSVVRLGVYNDNNNCPISASLLLDAGTVAGDGSTGWKEIVISQPLPRSIKWTLGIPQLCPTTRPTLRVAATGIGDIPVIGTMPGALNQNPSGYSITNFASAGLPDPAPSGMVSGGVTPIVGLRVV